MDAAPALNLQAPAVRWNWRVTPLQLALSVALLALGVRAIGLGIRPLWLDEAYSAWFSSRGWHELWTVVPTYEPHPPFYYSLLKLWRSVFGGEPVALRSLSVLFSVITIPVVVAIALEQERQSPTGRPLLSAFVAAFLMACSPLLMLLDQETRPYPMMIFAYSVAILGLLRLIREFSGGGAGDWRSWALLAVGTELALWAHGLGVLYALCLAAALLPTWLKAPSRARIARGAGVAVAIGLFYVPCLLMILGRTGDWANGWLSWHPLMLLLLAGLYAVPVEALTIATAVAALVLFLLIKRAVAHAIATRGWNSERAMLLLWLGPPLLAVLISALFFPVFLLRTLAATLVPAYVAIGGALARTPSPRERFLLTAALCITLFPAAIQVALRPASERWDEVNTYLVSHVRPGDQVWLYPNDSVLPLSEAAKSASLPYPVRSLPAVFPALGAQGPHRLGSPAVPSLSRGQANAIADDQALRRIPTIWLVTRQASLIDPNGDLRSGLARTRRAGPVQHWGFIDVQPYYASAIILNGSFNRETDSRD
jgi:mannosyltransferase